MFGSKPKVIVDEAKIDELLSRGVIVDVLPSKDEFRKKLLSGERLKFYIGFDPTANTLHLSHAKNLILLEEFRTLGHEVIVLFGDFTARIGDPSGRTHARKPLSHDEILKNVADWKKQIAPLMNFKDRANPPQVMYNHTWLSKLTFEDVLALASETTVQHILERDMFEKRMNEGKPIHLHEFLYPVMQGYDSVAMGVDVEMCGTDQTFNALMGRTLVRKRLKKEKFVVVVNLMENPKTGELMSKSKKIGVFLNNDANTMFGEVMAQPDEMMRPLFLNITRIPLPQIETELSRNHPKETKLMLAEKITEIFYGLDAAQHARENFEKTFSKGEITEDVTKVALYNNGQTYIDALVYSGFLQSRTQARRLILDGGLFSVTRKAKISDVYAQPQNEEIVRVGKKQFAKMTLNK